MGDVNKVIACCKKLGLEPRLGVFEHRLILQKMVFLLELKGVELGFNYGLYVRGPYSAELTREIYANKTKLESLDCSESLNQNEEGMVEQFKGIFQLKTALLEAAATYAFFAYKEKLGAVEATRRLKKLKPFLSEALVAVGTSKAKEFLYVPTDEELREMKKESEPWQQAALEDLEK